MILAAMALTVVGGFGFLARTLLGPSLADRVVALDGLVVTIVAVTVLVAIHTDSRWFLDVAVVVAVVGFVGTSAAARFIERRDG